MFGSRRVGFPGSGALAAIVCAFVAAYRWNEQKVPHRSLLVECGL